MPPHPHPDAIADCVLRAFSALPPKFKPRTLADGRREWVPLAGIVLSRCELLSAPFLRSHAYVGSTAQRLSTPP